MLKRFQAGVLIFVCVLPLVGCNRVVTTPGHLKVVGSVTDIVVEPPTQKDSK